MAFKLHCIVRWPMEYNRTALAEGHNGPDLIYYVNSEVRYIVTVTLLTAAESNSLYSHVERNGTLRRAVYMDIACKSVGCFDQ